MNRTRQWATLTAVACLAILAAGWFLAVKPQRSHAASLRAQTDSVNSSNNGLRSQVNQLRLQQKGLPAQQKLLSQIATKIPDNPALPALIRQLSGAADGAGVTLVSLAPSAPAIVASAPGSTPASSSGIVGTSSAAPTAAAAPLASIPLTVQVQGTYFNVEQFFAAVEGLNRAMLVSGFTLSPATSATGASSSSTSSSAGSTALPPGWLNAQITAQVFESPQLAPTSASTTTGH